MYSVTAMTNDHPKTHGLELHDMHSQCHAELRSQPSTRDGCKYPVLRAALQWIFRQGSEAQRFGAWLLALFPLLLQREHASLLLGPFQGDLFLPTYCRMKMFDQAKCLVSVKLVGHLAWPHCLQLDPQQHSLQELLARQVLDHRQSRQ